MLSRWGRPPIGRLPQPRTLITWQKSRVYRHCRHGPSNYSEIDTDPIARSQRFRPALRRRSLEWFLLQHRYWRADRGRAGYSYVDRGVNKRALQCVIGSHAVLEASGIDRGRRRSEARESPALRAKRGEKGWKSCPTWVEYRLLEDLESQKLLPGDDPIGPQPGEQVEE
jgi:hypothetical protein